MITEEKFEDLINLYIDREISPEDYAILKGEVVGNPDRRKTYELYRGIHHASVHALTQSDVTVRDNRSGRSLIYYFSNASLAAACVALAFVIFSPFTTETVPSATLAERPVLPVVEPEPARESVVADNQGKMPGLLAQLNDFSEYRASLNSNDPLSSDDAMVIAASSVRDFRHTFPLEGNKDGIFRVFNVSADDDARPIILERSSGSAFRSDLASFTFYR